ncbi:oxidoreductase [Paenibacillus sp. MMS18-CY102]|uniref:oxidoreductase n=1 Tax=Paenibacillus sp. MMS18-CY102 TaxID=2682849 RepID=UPI001365C4FC|nr:oxidoreductase [Paenibacillus sp. MMS18-CY102]MWC29357.1 oxidoreductase [Paenibacillus sp. MMS18-CY102]
MNNLECKKAIRQGFADRYVDGEIKKCEYNTPFYDFHIDGNSLYNRFKSYDFISALSHSDEQLQRNEFDKLLLNAPSELESGRYMLFVCPMCADLGCGAITVSIQREEELAVWKDFRCEDGENSTSIHLGPFKFEWPKYEKTILSAVLEEEA